MKTAKRKNVREFWKNIYLQKKYILEIRMNEKLGLAVSSE